MYYLNDFICIYGDILFNYGSVWVPSSLLSGNLALRPAAVAHSSGPFVRPSAIAP